MSKLQEIWKDINGYNGRYQISNMGRLKSFAQDGINGKIKSGNKTHKGYLSTLLYDDDGNKHWYPIHRLVASVFIPNPDNLPQVNHKDEDKTNNAVSNLEWCSNDYNVNYGTRNKRVSESNRCCPTTSAKIFSIDKNGVKQVYDSIGEAERQTGLPHPNIVRALKGRRPTCGGYKWYYYN